MLFGYLNGNFLRLKQHVQACFDLYMIVLISFQNYVTIQNVCSIFAERRADTVYVASVSDRKPER